MKRKLVPILIVLVAVLAIVIAYLPSVSKAADLSVYTTDGSEGSDEIVAAWNTGDYDYVCLSADTEIVLDGEEMVIDLAGNDLTVFGSGNVKVFDTANDTYDHTVCGALTCEDSVTSATDYTAPNGNRYIAVGSGGRYTFHRLEMKITAVTLRMSSAGLYYNATFSCDRLIQESVQAYGVAVSLEDIPGKNFRTEDLYTAVSGTKLSNGAVVNSGIVQNIITTDTDKSAENSTRSQMDIFARLYINIGGKDYLGTTYAKNSLKGLMDKLDSQYSSLTKAVRGQLDAFHGKWKAYDTGWIFKNIGNSELDLDAINAALDPTLNYCNLCQETVTWEALDSGETEDRKVAVNGGHYYLTGNVTYTGTGLSYFGAPGTQNHKACLHLNGYNITATAAKGIYGGSGVLNVMGEGVVTGYGPKAGDGSAIHTNNKNKVNGINLYGGTYRKTDNSVSGAGVIATGDSGRIYSVYGGATIDGGTGVAIYIGGKSTYYGSVIELIGCTVNGDINQETHTGELTTLDIIDATINGTVNVKTNQNVTLSGVVNIDTLAVPAGYKVTTKGLEEGTSIGLDATGYFTAANANLGDYTGYFEPTNANYGVIVRNNTLYCGKDYVSNIADKFAEGTTDAVCPVCEESVTWTALTQEYLDANASTTSNTGYTFPVDSHFYLAESITTDSANAYALFGAPGTAGTSCCLHLNGNNLTATATTVFYSANGVLNVMGNGTVAGTAHGSYAGVAHSNNQNVNSSMNFYAGTYTTTNGSGYVFRAGGAGGRYYFYDDAVIDQQGSSAAIHTNALSGRDSVLSLTGTTVNGGINLNGIKDGNAYGGSYTVTLNGATVNGTLTAEGTNNISLINDVKISLLDVSESSRVDLTDGTADGEMIGSGAFVVVKNAGAFALEFESAADFANCFTTAWRDDKIICRDNVLIYKSNYEMGLQMDGDNVARCPVCQADVTWTAVTDETASVSLEGGHYYLSKDLTFDSASDAGAYLVANGTDVVTCLHLNGHTVTSKQEPALAVGTGKINVMGEGTVVGYTDTADNGSAIVANNDTATNGAYIYSGTYKKYDSTNEQPVISIRENGGNITVYEDAVIDAEGGVAVYSGTAAEGTSNLTLDNVSISGDVLISGASEQAAFNTYHTTINGNVDVSGTNSITFSGKTDITGQLVVAEGSLVGFADMLSPDTSIVVSATGTFTTSLDEARAWANYFTPVDATNNWILARDGALYHGERVDLETNAVASDAEAEALENAYADLVAKYGEMHNHTSAGLTADGRKTLAEWKERMVELGMSFATIVDHKQVAHMYHKDWQEEPTEEYDVVFVGGSEPQANISELSSSATQNNMHYNMITGDVDKLISVIQESGFTYYNKVAYDEANWGANGTNNKNKDYDPTDYAADEDGFLDRYTYRGWTRTEFETLVSNLYKVGGLLVEVHPDYPSYIKSADPLDYCFSGDAGTDEAAAMGFEIHTANYGYNPSRSYNEQAYQLWLDMLDAGKKVYATYGDDTHRLPTAMALTTVYAPDGANAAYYMQLMNEGNFAPGWVGIRMQIGDTKMGGTATTFEDQRLVFSIGDMYEANDFSRKYLDKSQNEQELTWEPGYEATYTYTVRLYDDSGLLMESGVNPSEMNYYAIDADSTAKFYRIEVWAENADGSIRYRCGVSNPIWNAAAYATAE